MFSSELLEHEILRFSDSSYLSYIKIELQISDKMIIMLIV